VRGFLRFAPESRLPPKIGKMEVGPKVGAEGGAEGGRRWLIYICRNHGGKVERALENEGRQAG
jgi:hypothetical protein